MEAITYNGVNFKSLQTLRMQREHIRDDADNYVCTKWFVECYASYQPYQTSYAVGPQPILAAGRLPGETDLATLAALMKPRGVLTITSGGSVILDTPALIGAGPNRYKTDVRNGPFCEMVSVPKQIGNRHWIVQLRFLAHTIESPPDSQTSPVISNVWGTVWDVDSTYHPTKTVSGTAILRTDILREMHVTADVFRRDFFFPLADNYYRENVVVELSEDGSTLLWSFTDVARDYNIMPSTPPLRHSEIRKVEVFRTSRSVSGTPARALRQYLLSRALGAMTGIGGFINGAYEVAWNAIPTTAGPMGEIALQSSNLPYHVLCIRCDVEGDRRSRMNNLTDIALGVCLNNAFFSNVPFSLSTSEVICNQELTRNAVSCEILYKWADNLNSRQARDQTTSWLPVIETPFNTADQGGGTVLLESLFRDYSTIGRRDLFVPANTLPLAGQVNLLTKADQQNLAPPANVYGVDSSNPALPSLANNIQKSVVQALLSPNTTVPNPSLVGDRS